MLNLTETYGFTQFSSRIYSETNSYDHLHTELVQIKFNMGTLHLDNRHQLFLADRSSLGSTCPGLAESNSRLARVSDTPSAAPLPTLNERSTGYRSGLFGGQFSGSKTLEEQQQAFTPFTLCLSALPCAGVH